MTTPGQGPDPSGVNRWTVQAPSAVVTVSVMFGMASVLLLASGRKLIGPDPPRPASPRSRSPLSWPRVDPDSLRGPAAPGARAGCRQIRPHRHRNTQPVRPAVALRPVGGLPAAHHQKGAFQIGGLRIAVVPAWRFQRRMVARARGHHLG